MKKALKIAGIAVGAIALILAGILIYFNAKGIPNHEVNAPVLNIEADSAMIERGAYIVNLNCGFCHKSENGNVLSGRFFEENEFGKWYAPNITQHPEAGLGNWTDGEIAFALRTGIHKDGRFLAPMMPRFNLLSDDDLQSVIAYLRSDAAPVQPSDVTQPESEPTLLAKVLFNTAIQPLTYPDAPISAPSRTDQVAYGKYLSTAAIHCYHCHSASFQTVNDLEPEKSEGYMGGGNAIINLYNPEEVVASANITMHPEYGLGNWTEEAFIKAVRTGVDNEGQTLSTAMPRFTSFTEEDLSAIWAYLQSLPQLPNEVASATTSH
jgi:mono/diheme cytochrome c family protein